MRTPWTSERLTEGAETCELEAAPGESGLQTAADASLRSVDTSQRWGRFVSRGRGLMCLILFFNGAKTAAKPTEGPELKMLKDRCRISMKIRD